MGATWDLTDRLVRGVGSWTFLHRRRHLPLAVAFEILEVLLLGARSRRKHGAGLEPQKRRPGGPDPSWRRAEPALLEHRADGRGRYIDPELQELPSDLQVAPSGVLPAQPTILRPSGRECHVNDAIREGKYTSECRSVAAGGSGPVASEDGVRRPNRMRRVSRVARARQSTRSEPRVDAGRPDGGPHLDDAEMTFMTGSDHSRRPALRDDPPSGPEARRPRRLSSFP